MPTVKVRADFCKGCRLCVKVCPRHLLELTTKLNALGIQPVEVTQLDKECSGCLSCVLMCPEAAIEITDDAKR